MLVSMDGLLNERYFDISRDVHGCEDYTVESGFLNEANDQLLLESTFLSHCSQDMEDVISVFSYLRSNYREDVYIDKIDKNLPKFTNSNTAQILKKQIQKCRKFILVVTRNSKDSCWIPWELGYADGVKSIENIAIFPCNNSPYDAIDNSWAGQEYLGLYPRIVFSGLAPELKVLFPKSNKKKMLGRWLSE